MPEWIGITVQIIIGCLIASPILGPIFYFGFIRDHLYNYRERKCRRLYPEFFKILDRRDWLRDNELRKAKCRENRARQNIDSILKELPYTPLEDISAKQMEIEILKKDRLEAQEEVKKYQDMISKYDKELLSMRLESKQLTKLCNMW